MTIEERTRLETDICLGSVKECSKCRKLFLILIGQLKRAKEQLIYLIGGQIYIIRNTESLETRKIEAVRFRCHESDRIDTDLVVILGFVAFGSRLFKNTFSRCLIFEYLSQENTDCRVDNNEVIDRIRKKRFAEFTSVRHQRDVFNLCDTTASVYLSYFSDIVILQLHAFV